jgi:acyl-CoA thioesterase-1
MTTSQTTRRSALTTMVAVLLAGATSGAEPAATKPLPKVLILGDSISLGYTPIVKKNLAGRAEVLRPNENCQHTAYGLTKIKTWLGEEKWDVIHFNWGIWDTHMLNEKNELMRNEDDPTQKMHQRHLPEQYRKNLTELVTTMKATGAKLVFATTTPFLRRTGERLQAIPTLNAEAVAIMKANGVAVNDLYEFVLPHAAEWQVADKVHFNPTGNEQLGKRVSDEILKALESKNESKASK